MRFGDFLRATVLLSAGAATLLAALTVIGLSREYDRTLVLFSAFWWAGSVLIGIWLGRRAEASPPIRRLLLNARSQTTLPELRPGPHADQPPVAAAVRHARRRDPARVRAAGGVDRRRLLRSSGRSRWRRQASAVAAIEERDGVRFYIDRTSPLQPIQLVRTPGFGGSFLQVP